MLSWFIVSISLSGCIIYTIFYLFFLFGKFISWLSSAFKPLTSLIKFSPNKKIIKIETDMETTMNSNKKNYNAYLKNDKNNICMNNTNDMKSSDQINNNKRKRRKRRKTRTGTSARRRIIKEQQQE